MLCGMPHPSEHASATRPLSPTDAEELATSLQAFATASRLRILWALLDGERPADDLVQASGLSQSATSHQLRLLRDANLVASERRGRQIIYRLHDHHLPDLLAAMRHHHEHVLTAEGPDDELVVLEPAARRD
jgi:DNA-binding transcriptional ArsR family regulator